MAELERAHAWMRAAQQRVVTTRASSPSVDAAFTVSARDRAVGGNLLASAIAYRFFLWVLPMALLVAAGLGFAEATGNDQPEQLARDLGLGRSVVAVVTDAATQAERSRVALLALALVGVYTAGASGAKTVVAVHRFAWGMPPLRSRGGPFASAAFTGIALGALGLSVGSKVVREKAPGLGLGASLAIGIAWSLLWLGASVLLPHDAAPWPRLLPGAILVGLGTQALHLLAVYYLWARIEKASELYGGLGFSASLLLGLYLFSRLVVAAAVLNAALWERAAAADEAPITRQG